MAFKTVVGALLGLVAALLIAFIVLSFTSCRVWSIVTLGLAAGALVGVFYQLRRRCC